MSCPLKVFKLAHDQLAALLPVSSFGSLETALPVVCQAMCHDGVYVESDLRPGLQRSLEVLSKPPAQVLVGIRQWALEFLEDESSKGAIFSAPLELECPAPSTNDFECRTRELTAKQARGILANAFFSNCLDTMQAQKDERNSGGLDWRPMLKANYKSVGVEKMSCHMLYFEAFLDESDLYRQISFERIRYRPFDFFEETAIKERTQSSDPVGNGVVIHRNAMENPTRPCSAFVNFANPNFGYGKFIPSCTQEEILISCCPEIAVGMLFVGKMSDDEVVNVINVRRYAKYSGYLSSFTCQGPIEDLVVQDILTLDACYGEHFSSQNVQRDLNKAYASFRAHKMSMQRRGKVCCISTGKWGCGAFGGESAHKFVQQVLAAKIAGVDLEFSAFGDPESCDILLHSINKHKPEATTVANALKLCTKRRDFVQNFQNQIGHKS